VLVLVLVLVRVRVLVLVLVLVRWMERVWRQMARAYTLCRLGSRTLMVWLRRRRLQQRWRRQQQRRMPGEKRARRLLRSLSQKRAPQQSMQGRRPSSRAAESG